jgi:phage tail sheath protein FI
VQIESTTPIALVGDCDVGDTGVELYANAELALEQVKSASGGTIKPALEMMAAQGVHAPIIMNIVRPAEDLKPAIIDAVDRLIYAEGETGYRPDLITAPEYSYDTDVAARMDAVATRFMGTAIVDNLAADETGAIQWAENFASRYMLLTGPRLKWYDTTAGAMTLQPSSAAIAAMIARTDGEWQFGFADSFSNRIVKGISGTHRIIDYAEGQDCEAQRLRSAGITSVVADEGWRAYGGETRDIDPVWQPLERVRTFHRVMRMVMQALKWVRDRRANNLLEAKATVDQFLRELKGAGVALGYRVEFPPEKNTLAAITAGRFYMRVVWENMPLVRDLEIEMVYTDQYGDMLINYINGGE